VYNFAYDGIDLERIRERIKRMDDAALEHYGCAAALMAEHSSGTTWKVQLEEARAECRRRYPAVHAQNS